MEIKCNKTYFHLTFLVSITLLNILRLLWLILQLRTIQQAGTDFRPLWTFFSARPCLKMALLMLKQLKLSET